LARGKWVWGRSTKPKRPGPPFRCVTEKALGPDHPSVSTPLSNLAALYFAQRDWARSADFSRRSTSVIIRRTQRGSNDLGQAVSGKRKGEAEQNSNYFWGLLKAVHRLASEERGGHAVLAAEMFHTAQWAVASEAADSMRLVAARTANGNRALAGLARERQDLVGEWQAKDKELISARSEPPARRNGQSETGLFERLAAIDARISQIDRTLVSDFPDYAALIRPEPLGGC
jgi:hypothetical protein